MTFSLHDHLLCLCITVFSGPGPPSDGSSKNPQSGRPDPAHEGPDPCRRFLRILTVRFSGNSLLKDPPPEPPFPDRLSRNHLLFENHPFPADSSDSFPARRPMWDPADTTIHLFLPQTPHGFRAENRGNKTEEPLPGSRIGSGCFFCILDCISSKVFERMPL